MILHLFQIPIMYKFGAEKGRLIQSITVILIMVILSSLASVLKQMEVFSLGNIGNVIEKLGILGIGCLIIILYFLSYQISVKVFSQKEI